MINKKEKMFLLDYILQLLIGLFTTILMFACGLGIMVYLGKEHILSQLIVCTTTIVASLTMIHFLIPTDLIKEQYTSIRVKSTERHTNERMENHNKIPGEKK